MKPVGIGRWSNGVFLLVLVGLIPLEFYGKVFERGVGHYLKWQNSQRPQLGRMWERDRQAVLAQNKIQSIRSSLEESTRAIGSFKQLFERVDHSFPLAVSRGKFLQLYYDFPGKWSEQVVSPYELVRIDSETDWDRVLLTRFSSWITVGFIDRENMPVHEIFISLDILDEVQSTRTVKRGNLMEAGFTEDRIYSIVEFLPVLQTLDPQTRKGVFPDPRWFLEKNYRLTRVGVSEPQEETVQADHMVLGVEYDTDYYASVLLIPIPLEIANNMLSQIDKTDAEVLNEEMSQLVESSGEIH